MKNSKRAGFKACGLVVVASVVAFAGSISSAEPIDAKSATAIPPTKAEQQADLALWIRSGARDLRTAASYGPYGPSLAYDRAVATYWKWRNGPEFAAEVAAQQGARPTPAGQGR